jgi:protein-S-isoprenylcysteine O-methyltransferase
MLDDVLTVLASVAVAAFPLSEILLAVFKRARRDVAISADRGSLRLLWIVIFVAIFAAALLQNVRAGRLPVSRPACDAIAALLVLGGLAIRWTAILTLGRLFTVDVAILTDHRIVDTGLYRHVRHPSYAGLLLAFAGLGVFLGNWLSILAVFVPITFAVLNRIRKEEAALRSALGDAYASYCRRTRRLVPGVL